MQSHLAQPTRFWILFAVLLTIPLPGVTAAESPDESSHVTTLIKTIQSVDRQGNDHTEARHALRTLEAADVSALPEIIKAFDNVGPLAANWLRNSFETIADRAVQANVELPSLALETLVRDTSRNPRARRLAYEWLLKSDPQLPDRLLSQFLEDPSPVFRRDAVARLLRHAKTLTDAENSVQAKTIYQQALGGAVDNDQVTEIVSALEKLGETVNLQRHLGYLSGWHLIGPFDNREMKGFDIIYPPETTIDYKGSLDGQLGTVQWQFLSTDDDYGLINIAETIENYKGSVMYAHTEFMSEKNQNIELRLGTPNAWKLWINDKLLFAREEYHRGTRMDQFRVPAELQPGKNTILLKVLQNEQTQNWAQRYQFQLRVCDLVGNAVLSDSP